MADEPINRGTAAPSVLSTTALDGRDDDAVLQLFEEHLTVAKRAVAGGTIRVTTKTDTHDEIAEVTLDRATVDVERVPINRAIDAPPTVRHEGDTMIVPVVEERLVVTKQLFLVEELHIVRKTTQETLRQAVPLRRQQAMIERTDADGKLLATGTTKGQPLD